MTQGNTTGNTDNRAKAETPSVDVLEYTGEAIFVPGAGLVRETRVAGQITRQRSLLYFEVQFVGDSIEFIKSAKPAEMLRAIELLEAKVTQLAEGIERALISYGDVDLRHGSEPS